jgi:hypothetical protein
MTYSILYEIRAFLWLFLVIFLGILGYCIYGIIEDNEHIWYYVGALIVNIILISVFTYLIVRGNQEQAILISEKEQFSDIPQGAREQQFSDIPQGAREQQFFDIQQGAREQYDFTDYTPIGGGGYGIVIAKPGENIAFKLLKMSSTCKEAEKEIEIQNFVKDVAVSKELMIQIPRAVMFKDDSFVYRGEEYRCCIKMERIFPPPGKQQIIHCCLSDEFKDGDNIQYTRDGNIRGNFMNTKTLNEYLVRNGNKKIRNANDISREMGRAYGTLLNSGLIPYDVEYVLGSKEIGGEVELFAIDFGLCRYITSDTTYNDLLSTPDGMITGIEFDIYIPQDTDTTEDFKNSVLTTPELKTDIKSMIQEAFNQL